MSDIIELWELCKHGQVSMHPDSDAWVVGSAGPQPSCPGGKLHRFRVTTLKDHTAKPDDRMLVEVDDAE